mmetsp:Transcript_6477/g.11922  ORF Transcript_6477/g.11922 Transcript_6477/m.11922 type:complete len:292 (+) Transcript_6477:326-1201(+)
MAGERGTGFRSNLHQGLLHQVKELVVKCRKLCKVGRNLIVHSLDRNVGVVAFVRAKHRVGKDVHLRPAHEKLCRARDLDQSTKAHEHCVPSNITVRETEATDSPGEDALKRRAQAVIVVKRGHLVSHPHQGGLTGALGTCSTAKEHCVFLEELVFLNCLTACGGPHDRKVIVNQRSLPGMKLDAHRYRFRKVCHKTHNPFDVVEGFCISQHARTDYILDVPGSATRVGEVDGSVGKVRSGRGLDLDGDPVRVLHKAIDFGCFLEKGNALAGRTPGIGDVGVDVRHDIDLFL